MGGELRSAIYRGHVQHRRFWPTPHAFRYPIFQLYLDLDELDRVFAGRWLWSATRPNLAWFRRADYLGPDTLPLQDAVRARIAEAGLPVPTGAIRLLTHLRYFGYVQNPVSFYYCFDAADALHTIVAEITNTPWGERHAYVLPLAGAPRAGSAWRFDFDKRFHVSPFIPMDRQYDWRFTAPGDSLSVHMEVREARDEAPSGRGAVQFDASLALRREAWSAGALARCLLRYPPMTFAVAFRIYWHALLIRLKRNPFYAHPKTTPSGS
ncbi:MAG: DUF1365 domain-containing protein [Xanthomonadales bacterium]|jgi:hypothetical protein|nr:DUF1365 domain-containing protein [Xanthomonadales bacterium]